MMKINTTISVLAATILVYGLTGCGGDSGSSSSSSPASVVGASGAAFTFDGTWKSSCISVGNGVDEDASVVFTGAGGSIDTFQYSSTDLSCTGTVTTVGTETISLATGAVEAITGWETLAGAVATAPAAQDGSGPLSTTESFTRLTVTVLTTTIPGDIAGSTFEASMIVDDTGTPVVGYTVNYVTGGASTAFVDDLFIKQ